VSTEGLRDGSPRTRPQQGPWGRAPVGVLGTPGRPQSKATGNSRSESKKSPPLSVKIPENSRYENTAFKRPIRRLCKPKVITIAIYLPITN